MSFNRFLLLAYACMVGAFATGLAGDEPTVATQDATAIQVQIIEQKKVQSGGRSIIFNRVAPPVLPAISPTATTTPSDIQIQVERKALVFVLLSATVYDRQVTELRWFSDGKSYHVFSNIDFNYVAGAGGFEFGGTVYSLILGLGNETSEMLAKSNSEAAARGLPQKVLPEPGQFPEGYSSYFVAPDSATDAEGFGALEALHAYYDANRGLLEQLYAAREAARIEQERLRATQSTKPKDTVIYFWPRKSALYKAEEGTKAK